MSKTGVFAVVVCCFISFEIYAWAQGMKAGLWETTATMTWQKSPFQAMNLPPGADADSPFGGGTHTRQVCVTQEQIDKFGTVPPQANHGCQLTNINKTVGGMTAELTCTGAMGGTGTVKATWTDSTHTTSLVHFTGSMQMGPNPLPIEWTVDSTSEYKSADCGSVKPVAGLSN